MKTKWLIYLAAVPLLACETPYTPPRSAADAAEAQAKLSTDPAQARLWREASGTAAVSGIETALIDGAAVQRRKALRILDRPAKSARVAFPTTLDTGIVVLAAPELREGFSGTARVQSAEGEFLDLDLGNERILRLQAKVGGTALRARAGDLAQILFRRGDPFRRNDVISVRLPEDELVYALVGSNRPVRLSIPTHELIARQTGKPRRNSMAVAVTLGGETKTLQAGDQTDFRASGLTVKILASVAVQGESANVLPGRPYRLELLGWRTSRQ